MRVITDDACLDYSSPENPENPVRVSASLELLRTQKALEIDWVQAVPARSAPILAVHSPDHLASLDRDTPFDWDTPAYPGIADRALVSVGGALQALDSALEGQPAFSLLRPPGHHARPGAAMGFCYLNQVAVAALEAAERGLEVAVFDFDVHHGNGTEEVLSSRAGCSFFSIHQYPFYPGSGGESRGNCHNYPMRADTPRAEYRGAFQRALDDLMKLNPDVIAVSAGFDAFKNDPLSQQEVEVEDFEELGRSLAELDVPCFGLLEGGYSDQLPELVLAFLKGLDSSRPK